MIIKLDQASVATRYPEDLVKLQAVYTRFFTKLKSGDALGFRSELDVVLNRG